MISSDTEILFILKIKLSAQPGNCCLLASCLSHSHVSLANVPFYEKNIFWQCSSLQGERADACFKLATSCFIFGTNTKGSIERIWTFNPGKLAIDDKVI